MKKADLEQLVRYYVQDEIKRVFHGVEPTVTHRAPRGSGQRNVKKSVSVPREIWEEVEKLSGTASSHITNALRLYLNAIKADAEDGPRRKQGYPPPRLKKAPPAS